MTEVNKRTIPTNLCIAGGPGSGGMESDCESVDSGLEESGHSNLDLDGGFTVPEEEEDLPESIYENAAVLKSNNSYLTPVTAAIEKYQFGGQGVEEDDEDDEVVEDEKEEVASEEEEEEEEEDEKKGVVTYPPLDMDAKREPERGSKLWGVRHGGSAGLTPISRSANPTEDKIAKEIRELKERGGVGEEKGEQEPKPDHPEPQPAAACEGGTKVGGASQETPGGAGQETAQVIFQSHVPLPPWPLSGPLKQFCARSVWHVLAFAQQLMRLSCPAWACWPGRLHLGFVPS